MAKQATGGSGVGGAAVGFAPLALALLVGSAIIPSNGSKPNPDGAAAKCEEGIENFHECHGTYPSGCSPTGAYDGYLNVLKNQTPPRDSKPVRIFTSMGDYQDLESRTPKDLAKGNHLTLKPKLEAMGEGYTHAVIGYLYYAKQEGAESSNCELTAPDDTDFHIGIGFDKNVAASAMPHATQTPADKTALKETAVVVEMTPQYRDRFAPEWTLAAVKAVIGKQVKVVGQLMADNEHNVPKDNCGLAGHGPACWRASIWELHPVTSFQYCSTDTPCAQDGPGWVDIGQEASKSAAKEAAPAAGAAPAKK